MPAAPGLPQVPRGVPVPAGLRRWAPRRALLGAQLAVPADRTHREGGPAMTTHQWRWFWEPLPDGTLTDDHGQPAFWGECDACGERALLMHGYCEAAGPSHMDPNPADAHSSPMRPGDPLLARRGL